MSRESDAEAYRVSLAANKKMIAQTKAYNTKDIKPLIQPWLKFKLHMVFPKRRLGDMNIKKSIYGNEHSVTYMQCLHNKVEHIRLDRLKGYQGLVDYIEQDLKGQYLACKIFMDDGTFTPDGLRSFNTLCRHYYKGGLEHCNDPVLTENDVLLLYFSTQNERLVIHEKNPEEKDFKTLIAERI